MGQTALAAAPRAEEAAPQRADAEALPRKARRRRVPVAERRAAQDAANAGDAAGGDGALEEESAQAATRVGPRSAQDADASHMRRRRQRRRLPRLRGAVSDAASVVSEDAEAALPDLERGLRGGGGGGGGDGDGDGDGENGRGVSSNDHSGSDADGASHSGSGAEDSVASPRDEDGGGVAHSGDEEKDDKAPSAPDMPPDMDMPAFLGDVDPFRVGFEDMMRDEFDLHRELAEHDVSTIDRLYHQELDQSAEFTALLHMGATGKVAHYRDLSFLVSSNQTMDRYVRFFMATLCTFMARVQRGLIRAKRRKGLRRKRFMTMLDVRFWVMCLPRAYRTQFLLRLERMLNADGLSISLDNAAELDPAFLSGLFDHVYTPTRAGGGEANYVMTVDQAAQELESDSD